MCDYCKLEQGFEHSPLTDSQLSLPYEKLLFFLWIFVMEEKNQFS